MKKKLFNLVMVVVLLLTMTIPSKAVEDTPSGNVTASVENINNDFSAAETGALTSEEGTAEVSPAKAENSEIGDAAESEDPSEVAYLMAATDIPVTLMEKTGSFEIIPYRIDSYGERTRDQFTSDVCYIRSYSMKAVDIKVKPVATPTAGSELVISKTLEEFEANKAKEKKTIFVWLEFKRTSDWDVVPGFTKQYTEASNQAAVDGTNQYVFTIPAVREDDETYVAFRAFACVSVPTSVWWKRTDTANFSLSFSFSLHDSATLQGFFTDDEQESVDNLAPVIDTAPVEMLDPVEMLEASGVTEPVIDTDPVEMPEAALSDVPEALPVTYAEPAVDTDPVEMPETVEDAEPVGDVESAEDEAPVENADLAEIPEALPVTYAEPVSDTAQAETPEDVEDTEAVEDETFVEDEAQSEIPEALPVSYAAPVVDTDPVELPEDVDDAEPVEDGEAVEDAAPVDEAELAEIPEALPVTYAPPVVDTAPVETPEDVDDAEPVEDEEAAEDAASADMGEALPVSSVPVFDMDPGEALPVSYAEPVIDTDPVEMAEPVEDAG